MIGLLAMAAASVTTCPGGPLFAFKPGSASFTKEADRAIPQYLDTLNSDLWRQGWIVITPTVLNANNKASLELVRRREGAIRKRMSKLGISGSRVRFDVVNGIRWDDPREWTDVYPSTLNVPQDIWQKLTDPRMMC